MFILEDIRTTIHSTLNTDALLIAHGLTGVFPGEAPNAQPLPYIEIGGETYVPFNTFQNQGYDVTYMVHVWDNLYGGDGYYTLVADCYRLLNNVKLALTQYKPVNSECEWMTIIEDQPNKVRHIPIRVRLWQQA